MLKNKLVQAWVPYMSGRTIFVSHEWLGWRHADPNGEQLRVLKRILQRLKDGEIVQVESHYMQQLWLKENTITVAEEWKAAMPHMFAWLDFMVVCVGRESLRGCHLQVTCL